MGARKFPVTYIIGILFTLNTFYFQVFKLAVATCSCWQTFYKVWPDDGALTPKHVATASIKTWN
jgi:hypothetical protein